MFDVSMVTRVYCFYFYIGDFKSITSQSTPHVWWSVFTGSTKSIENDKFED